MNQEYNLTERIARQKEQGILYLLPHGKYDKVRYSLIFCDFPYFHSPKLHVISMVNISRRKR